MGHLVRMVVGDWERGGHGAWRFNTDLTWPKHDVVVRENESYSSLLGMVRKKYKLDQLLHPTEPVLLTYEFPNSMTDPGDYTTSPIELKNDGDVELFMSVRIDYVWLELCVAFGRQAVDHYRMQREVEDVEAEDDDGGDDPKTLDFRGETTLYTLRYVG